MSLPLADAIFWIAVACSAVAQCAIVRSVVIAAPRGDRAESAGHRAIELAWAVLPGVALAVLLVFTWRAMHVAVVGPVA